MTTKQDISEWFLEGQKGGATHMIVVCDTFDHEDYPVYVMPKENVREIVKNYSGNMQNVMEVYNLSLNKEMQLNKTRVFEF
jgi:hypothetical protein